MERFIKTMALATWTALICVSALYLGTIYLTRLVVYIITM